MNDAMGRSRRRDGTPEVERGPAVALKLGVRTYPVTLQRVIGMMTLIGIMWGGCAAIYTTVAKPWATPADVVAARTTADSAIGVIMDEHHETRRAIQRLDSAVREDRFYSRTTSHTLCIFLRRASPDLLTDDCRQTIIEANRRSRNGQNGDRQN